MAVRDGVAVSEEVRHAAADKAAFAGAGAGARGGGGQVQDGAAQRADARAVGPAKLPTAPAAQGTTTAQPPSHPRRSPGENGRRGRARSPSCLPLRVLGLVYFCSALGASLRRRCAVTVGVAAAVGVGSAPTVITVPTARNVRRCTNWRDASEAHVPAPRTVHAH